MRVPTLPEAYNELDNSSLDANYPLDNASGHPINTQDIISYYLMGVATTSICCVGIVGNILSLIVLSKPTMRTGTTHMYLIALAISDTLVLIFTILTALKDTRSPYTWGAVGWRMWSDVPFVPQSYPICHAFAILFQVNSVWLTVAFSADRYFVICHPFIAERHCSRFLANIIIFFLFLICICYNMPRFFEHKIIRFDFPGATNHTMLAFNGTFFEGMPSYLLWFHVAPFGASKAFRQGYHLISWMIFVVITPFISLFVMNSFLIREVRRSHRRGRAINASERRRNDTNVMLISVIVLFFICQVPAAFNHVLWGFITESTELDIFRYLTNEIGNFLVILNSAINIIPYYLFGRKFRQELLGLFCSRQTNNDTKLINLSLNSLDTHTVHNSKSRSANQSVAGSVDGRRLIKTGRRSNGAGKHRRPAPSANDAAANGANESISRPVTTGMVSVVPALVSSRTSCSPSISCELQEVRDESNDSRSLHSCDNDPSVQSFRGEVTVETLE